MEVILWLLSHSQSILEPVGILGGLVYTGITLRQESKARRVANIITITTQHRDIWKELYDRPELGRVLNPSVNLKKHPATPAEYLFVRFVILHLSSVFRASKADELLQPAGTVQDVREFISLPIPHAIWLELRDLQDNDFVKWVEGGEVAVARRRDR